MALDPRHEITLKELKAAFERNDPLFLLDVRESDELEISSFENIVHIPLGELETRFQEVPKSADIVIICRTGRRSEDATGFLLQMGYAKVRNMVGGMNGWSAEIDSSVQQY